MEHQNVNFTVALYRTLVSTFMYLKLHVKTCTCKAKQNFKYAPKDIKIPKKSF